MLVCTIAYHARHTCKAYNFAPYGVPLLCSICCLCPNFLRLFFCSSWSAIAVISVSTGGWELLLYSIWICCSDDLSLSALRLWEAGVIMMISGSADGIALSCWGSGVCAVGCLTLIFGPVNLGRLLFVVKVTLCSIEFCSQLCQSSLSILRRRILVLPLGLASCSPRWPWIHWGRLMWWCEIMLLIGSLM